MMQANSVALISLIFVKIYLVTADHSYPMSFVRKRWSSKSLSSIDTEPRPLYEETSYHIQYTYAL